MKKTQTTYQKYGVGAPRTLARLQDFYEQLSREVNPTCPNCRARENLAAIQIATRLMKEDAAARANGNHESTLAKAIQISAERTARKPSRIAQQRQATIDFLAQFDVTEPRYPASDLTRLGPLSRRGYLKIKGDGYVRTAKEFTLRLKK